MILYKLSYPNELNHVRTLVKPQPFEYAGWFLRKIGAIPSTRIEEKKGGAVTRIVNELKETPQCLFLISPKGTIIKSEWRSGYFVIAKELDAELIAISHNKGESVVKEYLQTQLSNIVPLFPDDEIVPIREHVVAHRNVVSNKRLAIIFGLIALIGYYLW
jgi:1-acyl-sn-glycerol-3-phosphate acyltransferase